MHVTGPRLPRIAAAAALALAAGVLASAVRGDAPAAEAYVGHWRYADGEEGRQRVQRAVDAAVDGLPFFAKPIAEDRVEARVGPFGALRFALEGDRLRFSADGWGPLASRLGGPAVEVEGPAGSTLRMSQRLSGGRLVQIFRHEDGVRRNTFALSGDGDTLWLDVFIRSRMLPNDATYRLRYRRAGDGPSRAAR
jgi:hypothetical protein